MEEDKDVEDPGVGSEFLAAAEGGGASLTPEEPHMPERRRRLLEAGHAVGSDANGWRICQPRGWD